MFRYYSLLKEVQYNQHLCRTLAQNIKPADAFHPTRLPFLQALPGLYVALFAGHRSPLCHIITECSFWRLEGNLWRVQFVRHQTCRKLYNRSERRLGGKLRVRTTGRVLGVLAGDFAGVVRPLVWVGRGVPGYVPGVGGRGCGGR